MRGGSTLGTLDVRHKEVVVDTIVCGIDDSASSRRATAFAAFLGETLGTDLALAYAVPFILGRAGAELAAPAVDVHKLLEAGNAFVSHTIRECSLPPTTRHRVTVGSLRAHLLALSSDENTRILVVGSDGHANVFGGLPDIGPLAARARCPLIVVMPYQTVRRLETIICVIDTIRDRRTVLDAALQIGGEVGAHVITAQVAGPGPGSGAASRPPLRWGSFSAPRAAESRVLIGPTAEALGGLVEEVEAALVVVGSRHRGAFTSAVFASTATTLAAGSPCPTMIVPEGARTTTRGPSAAAIRSTQVGS